MISQKLPRHEKEGDIKSRNLRIEINEGGSD